MTAKNIWLLTEERPKLTVVQNILQRFCEELSTACEFRNPKILPIMRKGKFTFCYKFTGLNGPAIKEIFILPVSGRSSFVDFMLFHQNKRPTNKDSPNLLIEETKTDDTESRNTGVYQRSTKFVVTDYFYPGVKNIMLYNLQIPQKTHPTATDIFGTRMLLTYGVEILGKKHDPTVMKPFTSLDELIEAKNAMRPPGNGVPIRITKTKDIIKISAKLEKNGRLAHDPNIGMLSIMCACIRQLGWEGRMLVINHGLTASSPLGDKSKFNYVAREYKIELEGLKLPSPEWPEQYWQHEKNKEKTGTIFAHVIVENLTKGIAIYENHGGCERGYFMDCSQNPAKPITVQKYADRERYKGGDKRAIIHIPDLVLWEKESNKIYNIEGKTFENRGQGIDELANFDAFEEIIVKKYYPKATIKRSLILAGPGDPKDAQNIDELSLYLRDDGSITLGKSAGSLIKQAVSLLSSL